MPLEQKAAQIAAPVQPLLEFLSGLKAKTQALPGLDTEFLTLLENSVIKIDSPRDAVDRAMAGVKVLVEQRLKAVHDE